MTEQDCNDAALFARIRPWKALCAEAQHVFPTDSSLRWFIRRHEQALIALGVLVKLPRGNYIDPEPFRAAAINLMRQGSETRA